MQLSVSSGKYGILQRATFLAFGDSTSHVSDYPLADMVASANVWVQTVSAWAWESVGIWDIDDYNQTDLSAATATLVNSQDNYSIPADLIKLKRIEVLDNSGNYHEITQFDETEVEGISLTEYHETDGLPLKYRIEGNSIFLFPAPDNGVSVTLAAGLKIYYAREFTTFSVPASYTTADTTQPGFDEMFHEIIPRGIAYDWNSTNGPDDRANRHLAKIQELKLSLQKHYGRKNEDKKVAFQPRKENYN